MIAHSRRVPSLLLVVLSTVAASAACGAPSAPVSPTTIPPSPTPGKLHTEIATASPTDLSLRPSSSPTRIPAIGQLTFPYESADAGNVVVLAGTTIDITWSDAPPGAERYDFFLTLEHATSPLLLGTDTDPSNGVSIQWFVPENATATLAATAYFSDGSLITSLPSFAIYTGQAPPAQVCTIRSTSIGVVDLFRERSLESENFAYIIPGTYITVLGRTEDGWYEVDAHGAYELASGGTASGTGWVSDRYSIGLSGPCTDVPITP